MSWTCPKSSLPFITACKTCSPKLLFAFLFHLLLVFPLPVIDNQAFAADYAVVQLEDFGLSSDRLQRIEDLIHYHTTEKKIAGAVLLIARYEKRNNFQGCFHDQTCLQHSDYASLRRKETTAA